MHICEQGHGSTTRTTLYVLQREAAIIMQFADMQNSLSSIACNDSTGAESM